VGFRIGIRYDSKKRAPTFEPSVVDVDSLPA